MRDYWVNKNCYFYRHIGLEVGLAYLLFLFQQWGYYFWKIFPGIPTTIRNQIRKSGKTSKKDTWNQWVNRRSWVTSRKYLKYYHCNLSYSRKRSFRAVLFIISQDFIFSSKVLKKLWSNHFSIIFVAGFINFKISMAVPLMISWHAMAHDFVYFEESP